MIVTTVLLSARSDLKVIFDIYGTKLALQNPLRDAAFVLIAMLSLWLTPDEHREANGFRLGADQRGCQAFRWYLRCHHPGAGNAAGWQERRIRMVACRRYRQ